MKGPKRAPCASCPYRRDAPSGLWSADEYERLPLYDKETYEQPVGTFGCHQDNGHLCAGWVATHDMENNLAIRLNAVFLEGVSFSDVVNYSTTVPVFSSGQEAHDHGVAALDEPDDRTKKIAHKMVYRRGECPRHNMLYNSDGTCPKCNAREE